MTALNIVRFRVKPGSEQQFIDAHRKLRLGFKGFLGGRLVRTGDRTFCMVGEWQSFKSLVAARSEMISILDGVRELLEDLGGGLGITDPVSGEAVVKIMAPAPAKKRSASKSRKRPAAQAGKKKRATGKSRGKRTR